MDLVLTQNRPHCVKIQLRLCHLSTCVPMDDHVATSKHNGLTGCHFHKHTIPLSMNNDTCRCRVLSATCRVLPVGCYLLGATCRVLPAGCYQRGATCGVLPAGCYLCGVTSGELPEVLPAGCYLWGANSGVLPAGCHL